MKHLLKTLLVCLGLTGTSAPLTAQPSDTFKTPGGKTVVFRHIKHASIHIEYNGRHIYIDPVGERIPPATDYSAMPKADVIFVTHEHGDHYDPAALKQLTQGTTAFYANAAVVGMAGAGTTLRNGDSLSLAADMQVWAVPAYNNTPGREKFHPKGRDNGYVLQLDGLRIYLAGDTEDIDEMSLLKDIDIAFLPCNQPFTMTVEQLVRAAGVIRPKVLFPYHYSDTPVGQVAQRLEGSGIDVRIRNYQ